MKTSTLLKTAMLLCVAILFFHSCEEKKKEKQNENTETSSTAAEAQTTYELADASETTPCECESDWFPHTQTPAPAEGDGSPFDTSSTTNCIFHQWSWQKFLWVTQPDANQTPLFLRELKQVDAQMTPVTVPSDVSLVLTADEQASTDAILKTNPNFDTQNGASATIYYGIYVNNTLEAAAEKYKTQILDGTLPHDNTQTFPVGSLEVKTSWVSTDIIPSDELDKYYTTEANIGTTKTTVALLGVHVVGIVKNHPEFIWATFEHQSLAPAFDWSKGTASTDTETLLFKKGSVSTIDGIQWNGSAPTTASEAYILFQYGVPRVKGSNSNNFMNTSQKEPKNYNNIVNINNCVATNLKDVWNNYQYSGSIWMNTDKLTPEQQADTIVKLGGKIASATPKSIARGSLNASNITMETYAQTFEPSIDKIDVSNLANCFSCHNAVNFQSQDSIKPSSPLYLSHLFNGYLALESGKTIDEINQMKIKEFKEDFLDKKK
ncbi:hypothetical protein [uncultured Kordia sp.]|uniref:hypothetical protein n=1 Tax=uncultured Kordia sp. TaxID=507699 RepID=UPI0026208570|nr:hypothetical protein [uncultured Kordia sp.]